MECQECHQNPATVHFAQVINGEKSEIHVCQQCAKDKGYVSQEEDAYSLHNLLSGLFNSGSNTMQQQSLRKREETLQCDKCGMTYQQFARLGKFGCASCYHTFADHLNPLFRKVHSGNTLHEGKVPKRAGSNIYQRKKLRDLKVKLQQAIADEAFEDAAGIRDQIKSVEKSLHREEEGEDS
ncbi:UvrB/UvrC motif-containing protein [Gracilibacillus salinarum]|uniref:UvrB/UvrC motif-containing protein n=1 Tax=Gracilibacillus salinarum TaxID=2932255 RepID=A0ABY4GJD9_9BACI|nr:UvrB/UvrC motif-containing protein [Gracilibacillus salinarum]UOQ83882.1 UvrB/UvrC motif-containing protein [Gracilibacillus salinarum]